KTDPNVNRALGQHYLSQLQQKYGDPQLALAAYNAGPGRVDRALAQTGGATFQDIAHVLPAETQAYVPSVMGRTQGGGGLHAIYTAPPKPDPNTAAQAN
ncbi:transglycosylase SLT domain-containing protein, partial [Staphylococcus aureus]